MSTETFDPTSLTINKLLTDSDALYQIPKYQRPYKWSDEHIGKLWDDLWESFSNNEPNYFLGSIITATPASGGTYLDVVDGQQRLTTLMILLAVIRDLYPEINEELCETDPSAVGIVQIKSAIQVNEKFGRLRLFTHSNHQSDFDSIIVKGDTTLIRKPYKKDIRKDEEPKYKFQNSAYEFKHRLETIGLNQCGDFINYVFNKVKIIRIDCSNVGFAIKLFQVLNARGLDLTNADLIKSFLLSRVHDKYDSDSTVLEIKEKQFLQDWISVEKLATNVGEGLNDLFVMYEYFLLASNPKRSLYDELVKLFENEDPLDIIADFKAFCEHYENDLHDAQDEVIYSFFYLRWSVYWKTVLTAAKHSGYPEFDEFKLALRRFYYLHWISGYTLSRVKQISFNTIKWLKEKRPVFEIKNELEKVLKDNNVYARVNQEIQGAMYHDAWCKPLLFMCEYNQVDNPEWLSMWDRNIHVEHILPQKFETVYGWKHITDSKTDGNDFVHTCGNLTLLSGKKNIEARNNPYNDKVNTYMGKGKHIATDDKVTAFRISQKLVDDYTSEKFDKEWNFESIGDRKLWFLGQVEEILKIDLSEAKK